MSRVCFRFAAALVFAMFGLACLIEAVESDWISIVTLKVNPLTRAGKVVDAVANEAGHLEINILDNDYFSSRHAKDRIIMLFGSSVAVGLPRVAFRYNGQNYRMYNFSMTGNSVTPTMKIFSIMSELHPTIALFAVTPSQTEEHPSFDLGGMAFGRECLGALRKYQLPETESLTEDTCSVKSHPARHFSIVRALSNFAQLLGYSFGERFAQHLCRSDDRHCLTFGERFNLFRSALASLGRDAANEARGLAGYVPQREHIWLRDGPPLLNLGELTSKQADERRQALGAEVAAMPNSPNRSAHHGADEIEHWETVHPNSALQPGGVIYSFYAAIGRLARHEHINLIFYNSPLDHDIPGFFPPGYYQQYRDALLTFSDRQNVHYLDEGDLLVGKGTMWGDTFHLNTNGTPIVAKALIYDLINYGYLDSPSFQPRHGGPSASLATGATQ